MKGCRPLTDQEIKSVLDSIDNGTNPPRDRALFLLGLRSGFRISELLSLRVSDVYQNGHFVDQISVARKFMKKKREGRTIPLHSEAKDALVTLVRKLEEEKAFGPDTFIFRSRQGGNRAMGRQGAWEMLKKVYAAAGITGKTGTHSMRKTFAKRVHEKLGRDLIKTQKALGHAQVNSTVSYLSFNESEIDDAILKS